MLARIDAKLLIASTSRLSLPEKMTSPYALLESSFESLAPILPTFLHLSMYERGSPSSKAGRPPYLLSSLSSENLDSSLSPRPTLFC